MIDVAFTPEEARALPLARTSAVVIDAVRASTTIVAALASGARAVLPVATVEEARRRAASWRDARVLQLPCDLGFLQKAAFQVWPASVAPEQHLDSQDAI